MEDVALTVGAFVRKKTPATCARYGEQTIPMDDVLVHTDAHGGNARIGDGVLAPIWFDWGDAAIGHPILDVAVLERPGTPFRDELVSYWLDAYQGFLNGIERSERVYHEGDVAPCLERAVQLASQPV